MPHRTTDIQMRVSKTEHTNLDRHRSTGGNSGFKKLAVQWLQEVQFSNVTLWRQTVYVSEIANFLNPQTVISNPKTRQCDH